MVDSHYSILDHGEGLGKVLVLHGKWTSNLGRLLFERKIKNLRLSSLVGWSDSDVLFLKECDSLECLEIHSEIDLDLSLVSSVVGLRKLVLHCTSKKPVDFGHLKQLKELSLAWCPAFESALGLSKLSRLLIHGYPFIDLLPLASQRALRFLTLSSTVLKRLSGCGSLDDLATLTLRECRRLEDIEGIREFRKIKVVNFDKCPKLHHLRPLSSAKSLEELYLQNCGEIDSLKPLENCLNLRILQVSRNTFIRDGEFHCLSSLPKLERVLIRHRSHYSHRAAELEHEFGQKRA